MSDNENARQVECENIAASATTHAYPSRSATYISTKQTLLSHVPHLDSLDLLAVSRSVKDYQMASMTRLVYVIVHALDANIPRKEYNLDSIDRAVFNGDRVPDTRIESKHHISRLFGIFDGSDGANLLVVPALSM
jgi:hypothetical protein